VLDTACARLALGQSATPPAIEDSVRQLDDLAVQQRILEREAAVGSNHRDRLEEMPVRNQKSKTVWPNLRARFDKEKTLVTRIRDLRAQLEDSISPHAVPGGPGANGSAGPRYRQPNCSEWRWHQRILVYHGDCRAEAPPAVDLSAARTELAQAEADLAALQGETPMIRVAVDAQIIGEVVSAWTGIPVGKMDEG